MDRAEAKRVRELLGLFKSPEAIDPHGILPLQIALSDRLFPGMSTQHTRPRYVLFAAWHAQRLVHQQGRQSATNRLRDEELQLMRSLLAGDDRAGVFGRRKREQTQTLPTSIYWSALQRWGIVSPDLVLAEVHQAAAAMRSAGALMQRSDDDSGIPARRGERVLPADFPPEPAGFPAKNQRIAMSAGEAEYLIERITASCPDSFLRVVFARPELADGALPWSNDPEAGGQDLIDARCFSELIHPARLMYTKLLVEDARKRGRDLDDIQSGIDADFANWQEECESRVDELRAWASARLDPLLDEQGIRLTGHRKRFVRGALRIVATEPDACWQNAELAARVRGIEKAVKGRNARLNGGPPFERWMKHPARLASQRLDYRWGNVQRFVFDLEDAS